MIALHSNLQTSFWIARNRTKYAYDAAGRITSKGGTLAQTNLPAALTNATYSGQRLDNWGATAIAYDNQGNVTNDGTRTFTWNARNQLTAITGPSLNASFQYDALGRRINKTINTNQTKFVYDGLNPVQERAANDTVTATLMAGLDLDEFYFRETTAGTVERRHILTDHLGSAIALTDNTGTSLLTRYQYEPYGETTTTGPANTNPYQYTGRENDGTGVYFYRARYYHPGIKRFISRDPLNLRGGANVFLYANANPVTFVDPRGLDTKCEIRYHSQRSDNVPEWVPPVEKWVGESKCTIVPSVEAELPDPTESRGRRPVGPPIGVDFEVNCVKTFEKRETSPGYWKQVPVTIVSKYQICYDTCTGQVVSQTWMPNEIIKR